MQLIPVTILSGYLGAGKTTLINELLVRNHDLRITVLVNDFGEINIDADLIADRNEDTIALTNGCACCTIGDDLTKTIASVLERKDPPDAILIEGSGVTNLARLKAVATNYPGLRLANAITLIDSNSINKLLNDKYVANTVATQIRDAERLLATKVEQKPPAEILELERQLANRLSITTRLETRTEVLGDLRALLLAQNSNSSSSNADTENNHPEYHQGVVSNVKINREQLLELLNAPPAGLLRLKGFVQFDDHTVLVQLDAGGYEVTSVTGDHHIGLQFIGTPMLDTNSLKSQLRDG